jgi:hypothetical protein
LESKGIQYFNKGAGDDGIVLGLVLLAEAWEPLLAVEEQVRLR